MYAENAASITRHLVCNGKAREACANDYEVERFAIGNRRFVGHYGRDSGACSQ